MFGKKIKFHSLNNLRLKAETITFLFSSIPFLLFSIFIKNDIDQNFISIVLIFFIVFFGLPHGALDSLIAKKFKIYKNFSEFLIFNFAYSTSIICVYYMAIFSFAIFNYFFTDLFLSFFRGLENVWY